MENRKPVILMVEDDEDVLFNNRMLLNRRGHETLTAAGAAGARAILAECVPDLIILDIMLPDGTGYDLCAEFRRTSDNPVLFLSGLKETQDKVRGMNLGGDYYLTKPYDADEFAAVVERLLQRERQTREKQTALTLLTRGPLTLDIPKSRALRNGADAGLTQKEFAILFTLMRNEGQTISNENLYREVWGTPMNNDTQALRRHIANLRAKLEADNTDAYDIVSIHGKGYSFRYG
jgi:DNA-binding response OmpR family regulator